jgi:hypothetical protein
MPDYEDHRAGVSIFGLTFHAKEGSQPFMVVPALFMDTDSAMDFAQSLIDGSKPLRDLTKRVQVTSHNPYVMGRTYRRTP